jgi:hypothetical protein
MDFADRDAIDGAIAARRRVMQQYPGRARAEESAWLEREALALCHYDGADGEAEIRGALKRAGLGRLVHDDARQRGLLRQQGVRGFFTGLAIGAVIGGAFYALWLGMMELAR